ncbi:putative CLE25 [Hibiscus syriacus]|uniref:CLE25 n=1 Tax=Hibiscus syriacus TaxID=106335 RepID=A0A6A2Y7Z9_HIBSY|nr:putative CLE25 [Hibiscus syriacus]
MKGHFCSFLVLAWMLPPWLVLSAVTENDMSNDLSGPIPSELSNCAYLNNLALSNNRLSGPVPYQLSGLARLKRFSVANNHLTGAIPSGFEGHDRAYFAGNSGLCGGPLGSCGGLSRRNLAIIAAAGFIYFLSLFFFINLGRQGCRDLNWVLGAVISMWLEIGVWCWHHLGCVILRRKGFMGGVGDGGWAQRLRAHRSIQVSLFQKPLVKLKLADLMAATNSFSAENIMVSTRTGTTYRALLPDGSALAIKRLTSCRIREKRFCSELSRLGQLRHPNATPLLEFCVAGDEKLCNLILLDEDFNARIMDFGLAGLINIPYVLGEFGYVAPEYSTTPVASLEGDLFGFGVVLLELITSQNPLEINAGDEEGYTCKGNLVEWINHLSSSGRLEEAIDGTLCVQRHNEEILHFLKIALNCVDPRPEVRWSMYQVFESLKNMAEVNGFAEEFDDIPMTF